MGLLINDGILENRRRAFEEAGFRKKTIDDFLEEGNYKRAAELFFKIGYTKLYFQARNLELEKLEYIQFAPQFKDDKNELTFHRHLFELCTQENIEVVRETIKIDGPEGPTMQEVFRMHIPAERLTEIANEFQPKGPQLLKKISDR
jgi:hypothetical protein